MHRFTYNILLLAPVAVTAAVSLTARADQLVEAGQLGDEILEQKELFKEIIFPGEPDGRTAFMKFIRIARTDVLSEPDYATLRARIAVFESHPESGPVSAGIRREELASMLRAYLQIRYGDDAASSLSRLVKFRTFLASVPNKDNPEFKAAMKFLMDLSDRLKLNFKDIEGNFAEISLAGGEPPLGLVTHMDVIDASDRGWKFPPFSGEIADGFVWGRGTADNKSAIISALYAMAGLAEANVKMNNRAVLLIGTSEESTWEDIDYLFRRYSPPPVNIILDSEFPVVRGEKGLMEIKLTSSMGRPDQIGKSWMIVEMEGGQNSSVVPDTAQIILKPVKKSGESAFREMTELAKRYSKLNRDAKISVAAGEDGMEITFEGKANHTMVPEIGHNAISDMIDFTSKSVGLPKSGRGCMMKFLRDYVGMKTDGSGLGINRNHKILGKTTLNLGMWREKGKGVSVSMNVRFPMGIGIEEINGILEKKVKKFNSVNKCRIGVKARGLPPMLFDMNSEIASVLVFSFKESTGMDAEPVVTGGTAYAKVFPNSIPFGPLMPGQRMIEHAVNERIPTAQIISSSGIYATAILLLAGQR